MPDPDLVLPKAIASNNFIESYFINSRTSSGNTAGLNAVNAIIASPLYEKPVLGGIWFFPGFGDSINYNFGSTYSSYRTQALQWFASMNLRLMAPIVDNGITYFVLESSLPN